MLPAPRGDLLRVAHHAIPAARDVAGSRTLAAASDRANIPAMLATLRGRRAGRPDTGPTIQGRRVGYITCFGWMNRHPHLPGPVEQSSGCRQPMAELTPNG